MNLAERYISMSKKLKKDWFALSESKYRNEILENINSIESELDFKFPEEYRVFIESVGLGFFSNDHFEIYFYNRKKMISFNAGENGFPEISDYIIFGQDEGSYLYIFDHKNRLTKGNNSIFRVSMASLDEDYFMYAAHDFAEFFELLCSNQKLNSTWMMDER